MSNGDFETSESFAKVDSDDESLGYVVVNSWTEGKATLANSSNSDSNVVHWPLSGCVLPRDGSMPLSKRDQ